jgi:hypothetical protein
MESAFMARKDERSTRLRQAPARQARNIKRPNAEFSEKTLHTIFQSS